MTFEKHYIKKAFPHYTDEMMDAYIQGFNERGDFDEKLKLAIRAGAFAIRNSKKYQGGWFVSGDEKIPWLEAEKILLCTAEGLNPDEYEIKHE